MMRDFIRQTILDSGAVAAGFAVAAPVDETEWRRFSLWLDAGMNAGMDYMGGHKDLRRDPRLLLEGARTVISCAFSYYPAEERDRSLPRVARYAYGRDYHNVVRKRLKRAVNALKERFGGEYRICIDSAPVLERFWAWKSGLGIIGDNTAFIVKGHGSFVFLAEILTTLSILPDTPLGSGCGSCGLCASACPGKAIGPLGIDSRRCLSYLTIEHRGEWDNTGIEVMETPEGRNTLLGCDLCLEVCPHNRGVEHTRIDEFRLTDTTRDLRRDNLERMTDKEFDTLFAGSPIRRPGLPSLRRNIKIKD